MDIDKEDLELEVNEYCYRLDKAVNNYEATKKNILYKILVLTASSILVSCLAILKIIL